MSLHVAPAPAITRGSGPGGGQTGHGWRWWPHAGVCWRSGKRPFRRRLRLCSTACYGGTGRAPRKQRPGISPGRGGPPLSVSGLHLMFLAWPFWGLGKLLGLSERWLAILSSRWCWPLLLAGAGAPALRAGVISLAGILGHRLQRPVRRENLLALGLCYFALPPFGAFFPGSWLSFTPAAACFSLTRLGRGVSRTTGGACAGTRNIRVGSAPTRVGLFWSPWPRKPEQPLYVPDSLGV